MPRRGKSRKVAVGFGCQVDRLARGVAGECRFLETGSDAGNDIGQVGGCGVQVEDFRVNAGPFDVGKPSEAELQVGDRLPGVRLDAEFVGGKVAYRAFHRSFNP